MARYTRKEFAQLTGINTKHFPTYEDRNKIEYTDKAKKYLDSDNPTNKLFIEERAVAMAKKGTTPPATPGAVAMAGIAPAAPATDDRNIHQLTLEQKALDIEKTTKEISLLHIKEAKLMGEVVPVEPIKDIVFRLKHCFMTEFHQAITAVFTEVSHKYKMSGADLAEYRGFIVKRINEAMDNGTELSLKEIDIVVSDHSEKRAVGERA